MNGVLTYSAGSNLVYCSGKEMDCNYYYYGLDWESGQVAFRHLLGPEGTFLNDPFYDAGNNNIIDEQGNIYFAGGASLVKLEIVERSTPIVESRIKIPTIKLFPNPAQEVLFIDTEETLEQINIYDLQGRLVEKHLGTEYHIDIEHLLPGTYLLSAQTSSATFSQKFIKL